MASDTDDEYEDLKQYFTAAGWKELSNYEKLRLQNIKRNYQMMIDIGLTVQMPDFMVQKRKKPCTKKRLESSDDDDDDWLPFKKTTSHTGSTSTKVYKKKQKNPKKTSKPKTFTNKSSDLTEKNKVQPGREIKKGKKKPKIPERSYPKRENALKCYKEEAVPDDDNFIYCEDCQEFYETGCLQHPLTFIEDTPVSTRSKNYCRQSLPSGLSIKETTIVGAGLGVFAEKNFSKGVRFGPYKGKVVGELDAFGSGYAWEICANGKPSHYVDAKSEYTSNWMRFVNCARNEGEQNLVAFQYLGQIYYRSFKPIPAGTELLVYYGKDFAKDLGIEMVPPSTNPRRIKQSNFKDVKSYCCEECGNMYTIHIYLLKHLKYSHGKPIYIPRKVERPFHTPVMLPKRVRQGVLNGEQHQASSSDAGLSFQSGDDFERNSKMDELESMATVATKKDSELIMEKKINDERSKCSIVKGKLKEDQRSGDITSYGEAKANCKGYDALHLKNADIFVQKSGTTSEITLGQSHVHAQSLTSVGEIRKNHTFGQSDAINSCTVNYFSQKHYKFKTCGMSSSQTRHLKRHERNHSGDKPYQCKTCGMPFSQVGNLKKHERIHSGEKLYQCKTCGESFNQEGVLKTHERIHSGEKLYQCKTCGESFNQEGVLKTHERFHSGGKTYQCKTCGKSFNQTGNLKTHERIHSGEKPYQCKTCGKSFNQAGDLKRHERIHSGEKPYQCKTCGKSFNQAGDLKKHERIHSGEKPYQCKTCGKSFNLAGGLKRHERIHSGEKPYQCKTCGKSFNQAGDLKKHERIHSGEKPYQCKTCGKSFNMTVNLKTHERIHSGEKPYQCKTCGKSFNQAVNLKKHERIHSGEKPYQCKTCGKSFNHAGNLKTHERIHPGEKPYQCKTCGKSFNHAGDLKRHERIHSGEKPYQCKTCGKSFNQAGDLKKHERIHSGEKPYQCKTCGKSFNQAWDLKKHERIHSGEKPYQCKTCGKSFNQAENLKTHERIHSGEKPYQCKSSLTSHED